MLAFLKRDLRTVVVAVTASLVTAVVTALAITAVGPANAHGDAHAQFAHNAGKLGGAKRKAFVKSESVLWAAVEADGDLVRDKGVAEVNNSDEGAYYIEFNRNVLNCVWQATMAAPDLNFGFIEVEESEVDAKTLLVATQAPDESFTDKPFHILVTC